MSAEASPGQFGDLVLASASDDPSASLRRTFDVLIGSFDEYRALVVSLTESSANTHRGTAATAVALVTRSA